MDIKDCQGFPAESYGMYVLGSLASAESHEIDEHFSAGCGVCLAGLNDSRRVWTAVGSATSYVSPPRALKRRVVQSVSGTSGFRWWQPVPIMAGIGLVVIATAGGWFLGDRKLENTQIAFAPVYQLSLPVSSTSPAPEPARTQTIVKEVTVSNPALAQALAQEQQRSAQMEAELAQQRTVVAGAQKAAQEAESRYQAVANQKPATDDFQKRLTAASSRTQELERQVTQYRVILETQKKRLEQNLQLASLVSDPSLKVVRLRGTEKSQSAEGHALIAGSSQMLFYASQLPALPVNRTYQLWLIRSNGQGIVSAGTFSPDALNKATVQLKDPVTLASVSGMSVTDEPAGGSAQPTGHKWMIGL